MGRKKHWVLSENTAHKKPVQFKIDPSIESQLRALDERIAREAPDKVLDRNVVVEEALREAIREATEFLDGLKGTDGPATKRPASGPVTG